MVATSDKIIKISVKFYYENSNSASSSGDVPDSDRLYCAVLSILNSLEAPPLLTRCL